MLAGWQCDSRCATTGISGQGRWGQQARAGGGDPFLEYAHGRIENFKESLYSLVFTCKRPWRVRQELGLGSFHVLPPHGAGAPVQGGHRLNAAGVPLPAPLGDSHQEDSADLWWMTQGGAPSKDRSEGCCKVPPSRLSHPQPLFSPFFSAVTEGGRYCQRCRLWTF